MKKYICIILAMMVAAASTPAQQKDFPKLTGPYLGQKPPGMLVSSLIIPDVHVFSFFSQASQFIWKKYISPEDAGWSSVALEQAKAYTRNLESAAVMVVYQGKVLISWGDVEKKFRCHSIRKAFINAIYGIYVDNETIDLLKTLADIGIDDINPLTELEKQARIVDLLMSRSGIYLPAAGEAWGMISRKPKRGSHKPGEFWYYNNWDFNALATIFEKETGKKLLTEIFTKIFKPTGMEDVKLEDMVSRIEKRKSIHPKQRIRMSTRDLARFGLLFEQEGLWNNKQIIPPQWIKESTHTWSVTGWGGYGYLWKIFPKEESEKYGFNHLAKYDIYYISGVSIHVLAIIPELNLVFVHRVDTDHGIPNYTHLPVFMLLDLIVAARKEDLEPNAKLAPLASETLPEPKKMIARNPISIPESTLSKYSGRYDWNGMVVTIQGRHQHLHYYEGEDEIYMSELWPISENLFYFTNSNHRLLEFITDNTGEVIYANLIEEGVYTKLPPLQR